MKYEKPILEIVSFDVDDVITDSATLKTDEGIQNVFAANGDNVVYTEMIKVSSLFNAE